MFDTAIIYRVAEDYLLPCYGSNLGRGQKAYSIRYCSVALTVALSCNETRILYSFCKT